MYLNACVHTNGFAHVTGHLLECGYSLKEDFAVGEYTCFLLFGG